jgi:small subunit ribosomal protein S2
VIDFVIPGNDDAIRAANLMCRIVADAVIEGQWLRQRRDARPGARAEAPSAPPAPRVRTPEERAAREAAQAEARAAAAAAQREREARLAASRTESDTDPGRTEVQESDTNA